MEEVKSPLSVRDRKSANKQIDFLLGEFRGKRIIDLLPAIKRRLSKTVLAVALERVKRRKDALEIDDQVFLARFEESLGQTE